MDIKVKDLPIELQWAEIKAKQRADSIGDWVTSIICSVVSLTVCVPKLNQMADKILGLEMQSPNSSKPQKSKPTAGNQPKFDFSKLTKNQTQPIRSYMQIGTERTRARVYFPCTNGSNCTYDPITGAKSAHRGVDITTDYGKQQHAVGVPGEGKVEITCKSQPGGAGNYASMYQPGTGVESIAMHLTTCAFPFNKKFLVEPGSVIGTSGTTGHSTGVHAHLGVLINGSYVNPPLWTGTMLIDGRMPPP